MMNDNDFEKLKKKINKVCKAILKKYRSTPATATECLEVLTDALLALGVEPGIVVDWQVLFKWAQAERGNGEVSLPRSKRV